MKIKFLIFYATFIEILAITYFFILKGFNAILVYLLLHFLSSILISIVLSTIFSKFELFKNRPKETLIVITAFIFITSVLGILFSNFIFLVFKNKNYKKRTKTENINFNELIKSIPITNRKFGEGAIFNINSTSSNAKLNLLSYVIKHNFSNKGKILKEALSDNNDEIRLMAFSILSKEENKLNKLIFELLNKLNNASDQEKENIYKNLGKLHWELAYLDIIDNFLKNFYLNLAKEYFEKSKNDYESIIYLGRIYLQEKNFSKAKEYFEKALKINKKTVIPYLSEIYFYEKNYKKVQELICKIDKVTIHPNFYFNYKVWCERN